MSLKNGGLAWPLHTQRGFTLLEVMVAVVILAIGLLGLAGLQATATRFNDSAYQRSQATVLAYDIADRMRANRETALTSGAYLGVFQNPAPACAALGAPAGTLAQQDLAAWRNALACTLPSGTGSIARDANNIYTITVQWSDNRGEFVRQFSMDTEI